MKTQKFHPLLILLLVTSLFGSCQKNDNPSGKLYCIQGSMTVDGLPRTYLLTLPPSYYDGSDFSLVIAMHGGMLFYRLACGTEDKIAAIAVSVCTMVMEQPCSLSRQYQLP